MDRRPIELPELRVRLQTRAEALHALRVRAVLREQHPDVHLVGLALEPLEEAPHAVPHARPRLAPAHPLRLALQHPPPFLFSQVLPGLVERNSTLLRVLVEIVLAFLEARRLPRAHCAFP